MPDEFMPLSNGGLRIKTPPGPPVNATGNGLLLEFLLPYPLHADAGAWPAITLPLGNVLVTVERPTSRVIDTQPAAIFGNDMPDLFCTVIRAMIGNQGDRPGIETEVYASIYLILEWLRVLGRQYWLLQGSTGVGAYCRGSLFSASGNRLSQQNFAVYDKTVLVRPLTASVWNSVQLNVSNTVPVPLSDSIFCDALLSIASRDDVKALAELGLAAEIELTSLLSAVSQSRPNEKASIEFEKRKAKRQDKFQWKLEKASIALGLEDTAGFNLPGMPLGWKDNLLLLYKFRGSVAHSGQAVVNDATGTRVVGAGDLDRFLFSVEALFHWSEQQRLRMSIPQYSRPWTQFRERPVMAVLDPPKDARGFSGRAGSPAMWVMP